MSSAFRRQAYENYIDIWGYSDRGAPAIFSVIARTVLSVREIGRHWRMAIKHLYFGNRSLKMNRSDRGNLVFTLNSLSPIGRERARVRGYLY
ncbi:MAG: hypothetical protein A3J42_09395 [Candidatus Dadabacteria bacterium RIFCSPHIGHO2_12_FULL_53_21]|nr:MAG: hypothetical protein A3J42_09395 [Candidatus Dadabacteria bacterium RIFCSPHIGHO2_12_FULL_53_21]